MNIYGCMMMDGGDGNPVMMIMITMVMMMVMRRSGVMRMRMGPE